MKDNKKLEEFLNTKVGELGKKVFWKLYGRRKENSRER